MLVEFHGLMTEHAHTNSLSLSQKNYHTFTCTKQTADRINYFEEKISNLKNRHSTRQQKKKEKVFQYYPKVYILGE